MRECVQFSIGGQWVAPHSTAALNVENPATEKIVGRVALGDTDDVDRAVRAARSAARGWALSSRADRIELLEQMLVQYGRRSADLAAAVTEEMGAPAMLARDVHVPSASSHLAIAIDILRTFRFEELAADTLIAREPIGVCGLITPWNWPLNQIMCKVAPALATGLHRGAEAVRGRARSPPTSSPRSPHSAGVPAGVFNLVHGDGPGAGSALVPPPGRGHGVVHRLHPGRGRRGPQRGRHRQAGAPGARRQEPPDRAGRRSPRRQRDPRGRLGHDANSGQTCSAPTRLLVPQSRLAEALEVAKAAAESLTVGDPTGPVALGPVVSRRQWDRIQDLIGIGLADGARLVTGGLGRPDGLSAGHYVRPTVFADVTAEMTIAREEIFGPVLVVLGYGDLDDAVTIAQRHRLRARRLRLRPGPRPGPQAGRPPEGRPGLDQRRLRPGRALRRLQDAAATDANVASWPSTSSSRPRRSWATGPEALP